MGFDVRVCRLHRNYFIAELSETILMNDYFTRPKFIVEDEKIVGRLLNINSGYPKSIYL